VCGIVVKRAEARADQRPESREGAGNGLSPIVGSTTATNIGNVIERKKTEKTAPLRKAPQKHNVRSGRMFALALGHVKLIRVSQVRRHPVGGQTAGVRPWPLP
jgi:hypothetical protein